MDDEGVKAIPEKSRGDVNRNIFPEYIEIAGPYAPCGATSVPKTGARAAIRPRARRASRASSATLARRAYRRPVTTVEVRELMAHL